MDAKVLVKFVQPDNELQVSDTALTRTATSENGSEEGTVGTPLSPG
jgi:hypothetical protein